VIVRITRFYGYKKRAFDDDNLYSSAKLTIDSLKCPNKRSNNGLSVILNDDPMNCKIELFQQRSSDKSTKILIEVLDRSNPDAKV
jgi:hypothetical protein